MVLPRAVTGAQLVDGTATCLRHLTGRCLRTDILIVGHTVMIVIFTLPCAVCGEDSLDVCRKERAVEDFYFVDQAIEM
jgi:hypothetical protein